MGLHRNDLIMSVDDFLAFTDGRPDEGRWELIDGEVIQNPSPSYGHQKVVRNLMALLIAAEDNDAVWEVLPGLGAKISDRSMPIPDIVVRPAVPITGSYCDDMIVAFEVLSPSSRGRDLRWKLQAYSALPSLHHYVVVAQATVDIRVYDQSTGWAERRVKGPGAMFRLDALGLEPAAHDLRGNRPDLIAPRRAQF